MYVLLCRESGLDCDFIIEGETKEEFLENGPCNTKTWYARR
jgi:predicted small metal-binding protein